MDKMIDVPLYKPWTMPSLTADGTLGGDTYAVSGSATTTSGYDWYKSFDGTPGGAKTYCGIANATSGSLIFYSPKQFKVTSLLFQNPSTLTADRFPVTFEIFGSNNGTSWTSLVSGTYTSTATSATQEVIIPESKYNVSNVGYKYLKISAENGGGTNMDFPEITIYGQEYVRTAQVSNGSIKVIDYQSYEEEIIEYGFCGAFVMSENDVILPDYRNTFLMGGDSSNIGQSIAAGLPNIEGSAKIDNGGGGGAQIGLGSASGAFKGSTEAGSNKWTACEAGSSAKTSATLNFSASNSSPIYGNSDTVQPPAICVVYCIQAKKTNNSAGGTGCDCPDENTIKGWIDDKIKDINPVGGGLSIGTIFSYASAEPPEGAYLLNGQTIYNCSTLYPDFGDWLNTNVSTGYIRSVTALEYEQNIAEYGFCGAFVISENDVRLPLWNGYQTPLGDSVPVIGNGIALGFTNGTTDGGSFQTQGSVIAIQARTAAYGEEIGSTVGGGSYLTSVIGVTDDPEKSGLIADTRGYKQDGFYWCIQVFNTATKLSMQESAQLASQMQMKAQTDLANVNEPVQKFKTMAIDWSMPDYSSGIDITSNLTNTEGSYSAPCNGIVLFSVNGGTTGYVTSLKVNNINLPYTDKGNAGEYRAFYNIPLKKNDILSYSSSIKNVIKAGLFIPLKEAKNPAIGGETLSWSANDNKQSFTVPENGKMTATLWISSASTYYVKIMRNNTEVIFAHGPSGSFESGTHYEYPTFDVEAGDLISLTVYGMNAGGYLTSYTPIISEQ